MSILLQKILMLLVLTVLASCQKISVDFFEGDEVLPPEISFDGASGNVGSVRVPMLVTPTELKEHNSAITSCTSSPSLPSGLTLHSRTCVISGTPTSVLAPTIYTITATNAKGSDSSDVELTVDAGTPTLSYSGASGVVGSVGNAMTVTPTTLFDNGSAISSCSISPALPGGLSIDPTSCEISGTPAGSMTSSSFTVTVGNGIGTSTASVTLTVNALPSVPTISYAGATGTSGTLGAAMSVSPTTLTNNGSAITNCSVSPALPAGLSINTTTCVISGTPSATLASTSYTVTATNGAGSSTASVSLSVGAAVPTISYAGATGTSGTVGVAMSVTPTTLSNNGSAITNCTTSPALPAGLSINTTTCVISGTPSGALSSTSYTVTATNAAGTATASVSLSVGATAPNISYAGATGTSGTVGAAMSVSPTTLATNGAAITNCTISPALPAGLSIHTTTCVISGTPSATLASTSYTVTVTNSAGTDSDTVSLTVAAAVPAISYAGATGTSGVVNTAMSVTPTTLANNGSAITNCTISPALPSGLSINSTTCVISGTPTSGVATTSYTVTVTNSAGSSTGSVSLTVGAGIPVFNYVGATGTNGTVGVAMSVAPTTLNENGGPITNCITFQALPAGLTINATTCVISGTPTEALTSTSFTARATNSAGSSTASVTLSVGAGVPTISYAGATGTSGVVGTAMSVTPTTLTNNGSAITNCTTVQALPAGLTINATTCVISGTPTVTLASTPFTVTVFNGAGSATAPVTLAIGAAVPTISYSGATGTSGTVGSAMSVTPTTLTNNGSAITNCTSSPALPAGLTINATTCVISGTPSAAAGATSYTVTATNAAGTATASVSLTVTAAVPTISYAGATGTTGSVGVAMSVTPTTLTNNGAAITNCTTSPALPSPLVINATTCVISGTPSGALAATSYTVTATNSAGTSTASVSLTVTGGASAPSMTFSAGFAGFAGSAVNFAPTTLNANGSAITNCTTSPALPAGLSINTSTCVITGTPTGPSNQPYQFTVTNGIGSTSVWNNIYIGAGTPTLSYAGSTGTNGVQGSAMSIIPTTLNNNGDAITNCIVTSGVLPAGLSLHATTCVISGTPTAGYAATAITVTAYNVMGGGSASVTLSVAASGSSAPTLEYSAGGANGTVGVAMTVNPTNFNNNGGPLISCTPSPALPAGLTINSSTCVISGTPTVTAETLFTVTATNAVGSSQGWIYFSIQPGAPTLSYAGATGTSGTLNTPMSVTPTTLNNNGGAITNCVVLSPVLPAGLTIHSTTCVISGTPTASVAATTYNVQTYNANGGSNVATVSLSVSAGPPSISYASSTGTSGTAGVSMSVTPSTLSDGGSAITSCTASPALPTGLTISNTSCVISGTPEDKLAATSFTVTATNGIGPATSSVSLTIAAAVPKVSYLGSIGTNGYVGTALTVTPVKLKNNGETITNCTISPALPAGLTLNTSTCEISGTPSGTLAATTYTITATNLIGASTGASVVLRISPAIACPANFIPIPSNTGVGTTQDFCVAKYEMKNVTSVPTSQPAGLPWAQINLADSQTACKSLGANYDLISNAEWMTIARDTESLATNWQDGQVGEGAMYFGHSDNAPNAPLDVTNTADAYDGTGDAATDTHLFGKEQKRTYRLSNREEIWDFAGNVWEWVDWVQGGGPTLGPLTCSQAWSDLDQVSCGDLTAAQYMPANPAGLSAATYFLSDRGLGRFEGSANDGAAIRGGSWNQWHNSGPFALNLAYGSGAIVIHTGFRCVYHP